ncbi:hypothetical protein [Reichenbachiella sp. 5M10]|uniref:hypothetical protein n=1 Tax=Reichenbachiella sp. 5M10 TaxID=1889772 RepID=UPI00117AC19A|nr:hypothetical protein [Reichenbachiella sp. 5M10]
MKKAFLLIAVFYSLIGNAQPSFDSSNGNNTSSPSPYLSTIRVGLTGVTTPTSLSVVKLHNGASSTDSEITSAISASGYKNGAGTNMHFST